MAPAESRVAARLARLLAQERRHLREGRFDRLVAIDREKAALVEALARSGAGHEELQHLRAALLRGQRLRAAAGEGLRAARVTSPGNEAPLRTYGPDGRPGVGTSAGSLLARRV